MTPLPPFVAHEAGQETVPVTWRCDWCDERIMYGDKGLRMGLLKPPSIIRRLLWVLTLGLARMQYRASYEPVHEECSLRITHGSIAHVLGQCSCYLGRTGWSRKCKPRNHYTRYTGTRRDEAREVMSILERQAEERAKKLAAMDTEIMPRHRRDDTTLTEPVDPYECCE